MLLKKIDSIDAKYVDSASDELFQKQPFFLSVLLGYRFDVSPEELDEIMRIYFLIWEYFRENKCVQSYMVTESFFEKTQKKNIHFLKYIEEETEQSKKEICSLDLANLKSKALFTAVLFKFNSRPVLLK